MWLTRFAINRWVITVLVFLALGIFGLISFSQLGRSNDPPGTAFPVVVIQANYAGASPDEMERLIVKPIEDQLDGLDNVDQVTATAQESTAAVVVQFKIDTDLDLAAIDTQRRVDTARAFMPTDLDPPLVFKNGAGSPILDLAVSSKTLSPTALNDVVVNRLEPVLKQIPNIETVNVYGGRQREFHLLPNPAALLGTGATLNDIFGAVANNNANLPGGLMTTPTQEASVSVHADIVHASDMLGIPLNVPGGAERTLTLGSVATAEDSYAQQRTISHYNGMPRLYVELSRNINADEIKTTQVTRDQLKVIQKQFPQLAFHEIDAPADYTQASLNGVWQSLFEGIFLTAIVMMLFLHAWRNAAVVMLAIPCSILSTFIVMKALGFHLDTMSMMGLALIIGILVDDSIVVLENITRHRDLGEDPVSAAINGRSEIGSAAVAITMVDVVVFLPVAFLSGIVGKYLKEYALVVVIATLMSLFVSFTLTPLLAAKWSVLKRSAGIPKWMGFFKNHYFNIVAFSTAVVLGAVAFFIPSTARVTELLCVFIVALLILNAFVQRYDEILNLYRTKFLPFGLAHGYLVLFVCILLFINAVMLMAGGQVAAMVDAGVIAILGVSLLLSFLLGRLCEKAFDLAPLDFTKAPRALLIPGLILVPSLAVVLLKVLASIFAIVSQSGGSSPVLDVALEIAAAGIVVSVVWIAGVWFFMKTRIYTPQSRDLARKNLFVRVCAYAALIFSNALSTIVRSWAAARSNWKLVLGTASFSAVLGVAMLFMGQLTTDFVPAVQNGHISMTVTYPPGTPIVITAKNVHQLENAILKLDEVKDVSSTVGRKPFGWGSAIGGNYARMDADTLDSKRKDTNKVIEEIRKLAYLVPGGKLQVNGENGGGSGNAIFYSFQGPEDSIGPAAEKVAKFLRDTPGSVNVQTSNEVAGPRLNVQIDAGRAAVLGVSPGAAANAARFAVDGAVATKVRTPDGLVDVRVQLPDPDRNHVSDMQNVRVRAADGSLVPLGSIATFTWTTAPTKIDRLNRERVVNVLGDVQPQYSLGAVTGPLEKKMKEPGFLPPGVTTTAQGDTQYMQQTAADMTVAIIMSGLLVYMLMVVLYGNAIEPAIVMFSVPVAIVGALMALAIMHKIQPDSGQSLNLISMLGIVMLFGLVAKNGILLVDYSNTLCRRGSRVRDAVVTAAATRFRPILMTTFAMVFGMLPLAIGLAEGAEWRQAMGTVIIGGLMSSLVLTLFLVPMVYNTWIGWFERIGDERAVIVEMDDNRRETGAHPVLVS